MGLFDRNKDDSDRATAVAANSIRPITASAQRMKLDDKDELDRFKQRKNADTWQADAWEYFDAIGEIKYSGTLIGAILSRVRLYPAYNANPDVAPAHVNDAAKLDTTSMPERLAHDSERVLRRLDTANGGISGILNRAGINIWVAGECYLVQEPAKLGSNIPEKWDIKSVDELVVGTGGKLSLKKTRASRLTKEDELPDTAFAGRIWRSHPRYSDEADSSLRSVRDLADELLLLGRTAKATARSRLNAGALYLPDGLSLAEEADEEELVDPATGEAVEAAEEGDSFEQELIDAMTTPIADEESASAVVPLIIRGPAELGEKIKQFKFERSFDGELVKRGADVLERIMHGLDIPKNIVMGMANVKYSNAVQIDEQLYKAHVEPLVLLICDALTAVYYRPALLALGYDSAVVARSMIWYDPSEILTRPDRAASANEGYDRKALSADAWRKAHGYTDTDAPSPEEQLKRAALERGPITPEIATEVFKLIAPTLLSQVRAQSIASSPVDPLSPNAQDILNGVPQNGPPANPAAQPLVPPSPPAPTTAVPAAPAPPVPTPVGVQV